MSQQQHSERVPKAMQDKYAAIVEITDGFCERHLDEDYARLIRAAVAALSRKRPSPIVSGSANNWACGVTHAIGMVNFLFDRAQTPHMTAGDLYQAFDVAQATGLAKSKATRKALGMSQMDPRWCLPKMLSRNPLVWMLTVNGMIVDVRHMPRELQVIAFEKGLIPYVPADVP